MAESTAAQAGLFASPLRNRFRPSRRGSKGWSSSSSQAGRGGGNGAGERGGGSAAAGLGSSFILGTLLKVGCCWGADCWMEQLLVPQRGRPQRDRCACRSSLNDRRRFEADPSGAICLQCVVISVIRTRSRDFCNMEKPHPINFSARVPPPPSVPLCGLSPLSPATRLARFL